MTDLKHYEHFENTFEMNKFKNCYRPIFSFSLVVMMRMMINATCTRHIRNQEISWELQTLHLKIQLLSKILALNFYRFN